MNLLEKSHADSDSIGWTWVKIRHFYEAPRNTSNAMTTLNSKAKD